MKISFYFFFLSIILLGTNSSFAQYQDKTILVKLHAPKKTELLQNRDLFDFLKKIDGSIFPIFPNHQIPTEPTNTYGQQLVDLSLWMQIEYKHDFPEGILIKKLKNTGLFQIVERRPLNTIFYIPNDSLLGHQWYLANIKAFSAWDMEQGDTNVIVGITDTGIDRLGEDLKDGIKYNYQDPVDGIDNDYDGFIDNFCGWDVGSNDNNVQWGPIGHGTFVAGFVSAVPDNGKGIAGVGYHIKILPVKIDDTEGDLVHDYEGIVYAADHKAAIINCSWGGPIFTQFGKDIVNYATFNRNALVVAACGNSNNEVWMYPASYEHVLSVAATDSLDVRWAQSSYGSQVDLCAPGTFVYSTWVNNVYFSSHGTSFSAPMVAAAAALVKSKYPWMNALQLGEQMRVTTDYIDSIAGNFPTKDQMGSGRLNMYKALTDTLSPSIRFADKTVVYSAKNHMDTIMIQGVFTNYLAPSSNQLTATLSCNSPFIQILDSIVNLGVMNTLGSKTNTNFPFKIKTLASIPFGEQVDLKITYRDGSFSAFEFFRLELNKDYLEIDTNNISLTITSASRIGFNDDDLNQGIGMIYKGQRTMLSMGGLLIATSGNRVSDNIYSDQSYDHDFRTLIPVTETAKVRNSDQSFFCSFDDNNAGFGKQNVFIKQYSYAFNQIGKQKFIILEYHIFNTGSSSLTNLYTALFADFDIGKSSRNKANYDVAHKLSYTYPSIGGKYAGIMLLDGKNANAYNIDNDGSNGSVSIYDGFYDFEKFQTMTQKRDSAGYGLGSDVSNMLSAGPYSIAPNDSIVVCFAILAGDHLYDIKQVAQEAYDTYYNTASISDQHQKKSGILLEASPNPFNDETTLRIQNPKYQDLNIELFDSYGRLLKKKRIINAQKGTVVYSIQAKKMGLKTGVYYVVISSKDTKLSSKIIRVD